MVLTYRKFSNKGASPNKANPWFLGGHLTKILTFLAISQSKMVPFSFCKKSVGAGRGLFLIKAPMPLLPRPAPLLENLWYFNVFGNDLPVLTYLYNMKDDSFLVPALCLL